MANEELKDIEEVSDVDIVKASEVQEVAPSVSVSNVTAGFTSAEGFGLLQRMAKLFASSSLVPQHFQNNISNCAIALNMSQRLGADPLLMMQNLYIVHGNPGWSSKFLIAMFNQCGRYTSIKYRETGTKGTDSQGVVAYTTEKDTDELIEGPEVTIAIAKKEGWFGKNGSKWQTMPDQMLRYRAAAWMIRTTAPELAMGLQTEDELRDVMPERNITKEAIDEAQREVEANANQEVFAPKELPKAEEAVKLENPLPPEKKGVPKSKKASKTAETPIKPPF